MTASFGDVAGVTDITDITDVVGVADVTDVTDITDVAGVTDVTDITGSTVRHMAYIPISEPILELDTQAKSSPATTRSTKSSRGRNTTSQLRGFYA